MLPRSCSPHISIASWSSPRLDSSRIISNAARIVTSRLEGLRKVVTNLQRMEQLATPLTLEQTVARRIELAGERESLLDRFEQSMSIFNRQSPILAMFGVVIALTLFIYLFSYTLHLRETATTPVIFEDLPASLSTSDEPAEGSRLVVVGRDLLWSGGVWVEEGVSAAAVSRTLAIDSEQGARIPGGAS